MSVPEPQTTTFRDMSDTLSPTYLLGPNGKAYRYSMAVLWDAIADGAAFATLARFPTRAPADAFVWLEEDREIVQGFAESEASFINRLIQWLDTWGFAGTTTGLLISLLGYLLPTLPKVLTVDNNGQWWTYAAGTVPLGPPPASMPLPPLQTLTAPSNWRWDSVSWPPAYAALWARVWPVLFSTGGTPWGPPTATYGGGATYGDGTCWGWSGTRGQAAGITTIAGLQRAGHAAIPFVIVTYDATMFDVSQAFGSSKLPDGNWGHWSKVVAGQYVAARPPATTCSFLDGAF